MDQQELDLEMLEAAGEGDLTRLREVLSRGADTEAKYRDGWMALHLAVISHVQGEKADSIGCIKCLFEYGANINALSGRGGTPLHTAVSAAKPDIVRLLVHFGADVSIKDRDGQTPLGMAVEKAENISTRYQEIVDYLTPIENALEEQRCLDLLIAPSEDDQDKMRF